MKYNHQTLIAKEHIFSADENKFLMSYNKQKKSPLNYILQTYAQRKFQSTFIVAIGIINSFLEGIGITLLIPILSLLMDPSGAQGPGQLSIISQYFTKVYAWLGLELTIASALTGFAIVVVASQALVLMQKMFIARFNSQYEYELSCTLYQRLFSAQWSTLSKLMRGELLNTIAKEINFARSVFYSFLNILSFLVKIIILMIFSFLISVKLTFAVIGLGIAIGLIVQRLSQSARRLGDKAKDSRSSLMNVLLSVLDNLKFIKLMSLENDNYTQLEHVTKTFRNARIHVEWQKEFVTFVTTAIMTALFATVMYFGSSTFKLTLPLLLALMFIYARMSPVMIQMFSLYNWINSMLISVTTVEETIAELQQGQEKTSGKKAVRLEGDIQFSHVDFAYDQKNVLEDANFTIHKGEYVAIVGETGSGKTTILDLLLLLLYPTKGDVYINGIKSRDIDIAAWRESIAYVGPENYLIAQSIEKNLLIAQKKEKPSEGQMWDALKKASLDQFVANFEQGLKTVLLDRGQNLSTGQKQRLNLARAFLRDADILIMDEPTSALDFETEKAVRKEIMAFKGNKTLITVTHKKELVQDADRILEINNKRVVEVSHKFL